MTARSRSLTGPVRSIPAFRDTGRHRTRSQTPLRNDAKRAHTLRAFAFPIRSACNPDLGRVRVLVLANERIARIVGTAIVLSSGLS